MKKQFNQQQKLIIIEKGEKIGVKQAAEVSKVHYTTVSDLLTSIKSS